MKKNKYTSGQSKKKSSKIADSKEPEKPEGAPVKSSSLDEEEQGFGGWLKSTDGIETMKLFVIANTIVMLTTIVYPHVQTAITIVYDMIYGPDTLY